MTSAQRPTEQDFELLSAYVDNELGVSQRAALEMRLSADPELSAALDALRYTLQIVRAAPHLTPPRNYILDPSRFRRPGAWWSRFGTLQFIGALGSAAATLLIVLGFALTGLGASAPRSAPAAANVALYSTSTLEFDNLADQTKTDRSSEKPTVLLQITTTLQESSAKSAASGFADPRTSAPSPTALSTQRASVAATLSPLQPPSASGSGGAQPSPDSQANALSGAVGPAPAQPSPSLANAADSAAQSGAPSDKMNVPSATAFPAATLPPTHTETPTATVTAMPATAMAKTARDITAAAVFSTSGAPSGEQQPQDSAATTIHSDNNLQSAPKPSLAQLLLIVGTALLVFSAMLAGIGVLKARTGRNR